MGKQVTVLSGFKNIALPSPTGQNYYSGGDIVTLTDAEYAALPTSITRGLGSPTNVSEPNRASVDAKAISANNNTNASGTVLATPGYNAYLLKGATTVNLSGFAAGSYSVVRVELTQDSTGGRVVTLPTTGVRWVGGTVPTLTTTANKTDILEFFSRDGGANIFARVLGLNF